MTKTTKVTPTPDTILTEIRLTDKLINGYDLKRAGLPKRYHQEHKQGHRDKGSGKKQSKREKKHINRLYLSNCLKLLILHSFVVPRAHS